MDKSKPVYKLRWEDFKPFFIGLMEYEQRCRWEAISQTKPGGMYLEDYLKKCSARKVFLGLYNSIIIPGAVGGALFGLAKLVFE